MGNNPAPSGFNIDILAQFKQLSTSQRGVIMQHTESEQTYLLKEYTYASDMHYEQQRARFQREIIHPAENVLNIFKIKTHAISGLCSTTHKIYAIYEYPQVSLQDEIIARKKEDKRFQQNELWSVLQSCNTALSQLKSSISLNTNTVFITPEGQLKVVHNDMITEQYRFSLDRTYFYAPEKISNFNRLDNQVSVAKEAVFSMGMTLLQAALLIEQISCYDFDQPMFLEDEVVQHLEQLQKIYSADFIEILQLLLSVNPNSRPSFSQIQKLLDNYWNNTSQIDKQAKNGESLNIQIYDAEKRFLMTSQDGVFKNLATITSNQKESVRRDNLMMNNSPPTRLIGQTEQKDKQTQPQIKPQKVKASQVSEQKQNIYTDPKLLEMIKKDLECINKLKQSTLKQTIKYSFLYPGDSIFSSIKDLKLSYPHKSESNTKYPNITSTIKSGVKPLQQSVQNKLPTHSEFQAETHQQSEKKRYLAVSSKSLKQKQQTHVKENLVYCQQTDTEGHLYEGYKLNGLKHGKGKLMFEDGAFYQGEFIDDQMNGRGVLYYNEDKPAYDGMWVNGQFHGSGVLYNQNPQHLGEEFNFRDFDEIEDYWRKYEGEFYFDNKCGKGKLYLTNGEVIEGRFDNDMINGQCEFRSKQGRNIKGLWEQNRLIQIIE